MKTQFEFICERVQALPYGRNANRFDFNLVENEGKGTCSSKHAYLKMEADELGEEGVKLMLGMYKMTEVNTPGIGGELSNHDLEYLPEAHCYLRVKGEPKDFTSQNSSFSRIESDLLKEIEIEAFQVAEFKVNFHKAFVQEWLISYNVSFSFEEIWLIREQCIANLELNRG